MGRKKQVERIINFSEKTAIDIGCGNGWALRKFISFGGKYDLVVIFSKND